MNDCIELHAQTSSSRIDEDDDNNLAQLQKSLDYLLKMTSDVCKRMDVIIERKNARKNVCTNKSVLVPYLNLQNTFVSKEIFLNNNNNNKKKYTCPEYNISISVAVPMEEKFSGINKDTSIKIIFPQSSQNITDNNNGQDKSGCTIPDQCIPPAKASHKLPSVSIVSVSGMLNNENSNNTDMIAKIHNSWSELFFTCDLTVFSLFNREGIG